MWWKSSVLLGDQPCFSQSCTFFFLFLFVIIILFYSGIKETEMKLHTFWTLTLDHSVREALYYFQNTSERDWNMINIDRGHM